ncbi:MAG: aldehyde ferredoxin oxidoreductase C-terminal domain-containing protein [bacterium]
MADQTRPGDTPGGIAGKILRVDLSAGKSWPEPLPPEDYRALLGGVGLGAKILFEEVPPEAGWDHPDNRLIMATGPLAGLPVWGSGGLTVVTRGAMTNGATSTQANGYFGAALKYSGYDAIVLQGASPEWVYLFIHDDVVELRDAAHLLGKDSWETQDALTEELGFGGHRLSVYTSGVAGENQVRFAAIHGDYGHIASKNGCGAVLGAKKVKAVAIVRGSKALPVHDVEGLYKAADNIAHGLRTDPTTKGLYLYGTLGGVANLSKMGVLPIRNYTTNEIPADVDMEQWQGPALREGFDHRGHQCNACGMHHCHQVVLAQGAHKGDIVDEPEYEGWSSSWAMGITDPTQASWLNTQMDRAVVDCNEMGWLIGWVMECYEKGYLTKEQLDGIEMNWGDAEAANALLQKIIHREGIGDLLAEGVKKASEKIGGEAAKCAIYVMKGSAPRGHDHRGRWEEMLDTAVGSTGTLESGMVIAPHEMGLPARSNPFDPVEVPTVVAKMLGRRHFEDSLGTCLFTTRTTLKNLCDTINAATGWDYTPEEAIRFSRRTAVYLRAFNLRCGIGPELERPSQRYGSTQTNGPGKGKAIGDHWDDMVKTWYELVEYDQPTGKPKKELLQRLDMPEVEKELWG